MMSPREREEFIIDATGAAEQARAQGEEPARRLAAGFAAARRAHPEDAAWLLALWDRLVGRPAL